MRVNILSHIVLVVALALWVIPTLGGTIDLSESRPPADQEATEPSIKVTPLWLAVQLVPSPEWSIGSGNRSRFGMRWQATPLLYSFGLNKRLSPWRSFVVEPFTRQSGSIELFFTPEYLNADEKNHWMFRTGLRGYLPLWQRGEYLSISVGSSYYAYGGQQGWSYETGLFTFFGIVVIQATYSPSLKRLPVILTLRLRYF